MKKKALFQSPDVKNEEDTQIRALYSEAASAGDLQLAWECARALLGGQQARINCLAMIHSEEEDTND